MKWAQSVDTWRGTLSARINESLKADLDCASDLVHSFLRQVEPVIDTLNWNDGQSVPKVNEVGKMLKKMVEMCHLQRLWLRVSALTFQFSFRIFSPSHLHRTGIFQVFLTRSQRRPAETPAISWLFGLWAPERWEQAFRHLFPIYFSHTLQGENWLPLQARWDDLGKFTWSGAQPIGSLWSATDLSRGPQRLLFLPFVGPNRWRLGFDQVAAAADRSTSNRQSQPEKKNTKKIHSKLSMTLKLLKN